MDSTLDARHACIMMLQDFYKSHKPIDFFERIHFKGLCERDRILAHAIVTTLMRHHGEIDFLIDQFMKRPFSKLSIERHLIRIGITQLLFIDSIPEHAAIHGTVELTKEMGRTKASHVINAILRRAQREGLSLLGQHKHKYLNIPEWLKSKLTEYYGRSQRDDIMANMLKQARIDLRIRQKTHLSDIQKCAYAVPLHPETYRIQEKNTPITTLPGWEKGHLYVQDAITQMPARFLEKHLNTQGSILDMCAAPGGKTIQLCDAFPHRDIIASDFNFGRLKRLRENITRCQVHPLTLCANGTKLPLNTNTIAGILLDAPCSATGTTRRHPDILQTRTLDDIEELITLQQSLLTEAIRVLKPAGILVYSTCSLMHSESEQQTTWLLSQFPDMELIPLTSHDTNNQQTLTKKGELRATPAQKLDGFYTAVFKKNA